jgi:ribosomal protein S27AE
MNRGTQTRQVGLAASGAAAPVRPCPRCGEERLIERLGPRWLCAVCAFDWLAEDER